MPSSVAVAFRFAVGWTWTRAPVGRVDGLAVDLERRRAVHDDVELLLAGLAEQGLVMLV